MRALAGTRTQVYVTNMEGLERKGRVLTVGEDGINLTFAGRETLVPWSEVALVERRGDPVWDGALKGAGIATVLYGLGRSVPMSMEKVGASSSSGA